MKVENGYNIRYTIRVRLRMEQNLTILEPEEKL